MQKVKRWWYDTNHGASTAHQLESFITGEMFIKNMKVISITPTLYEGGRIREAIVIFEPITKNDGNTRT